MSKYSKIRHIVRLRQMLRSWRIKATSPSSHHRSPPDVPAGHVAICVGSNRRRFVVRASHLNHPIIRRLLSQVEEEYGFSSRPGPLAIPCDESLFEEILRLVSAGVGDSAANSEFHRCCDDVVSRNRNPNYCFSESRPLLY